MLEVMNLSVASLCGHNATIFLSFMTMAWSMIKVSFESTGAIHLDLIIKSTFIQIQIPGLRKTTQSYSKFPIQ